jgi:phage shock protein E
MISLRLMLVFAVAGLLATGCSQAQPSRDAAANVAHAEPTPQTAKALVKDVSLAEFNRLLAELDGALLLDVRTPEEWAEGHLEGAAHKDYWGDADFDDAMNSIPRDRPVLVYCAGGGRSGLTAQELHEAGHREVYNLADGISGWIREGQPVVTGPPAPF